MAVVKKTINIDSKLLKDAKAACKASTYTETIRQGLVALVQHEASQRLREFGGSEAWKGKIEDVPRRREKPMPKRRRRTA